MQYMGQPHDGFWVWFESRECLPETKTVGYPAAMRNVPFPQWAFMRTSYMEISMIGMAGARITIPATVFDFGMTFDYDNDVSIWATCWLYGGLWHIIEADELAYFDFPDAARVYQM